jgi:hypothetical protein
MNIRAFDFDLGSDLISWSDGRSIVGDLDG